ncbi:hypothetical protein BHM03_00025336 [Ensete ventricosum]|nr:hypothetical protein BHM03_00025336 [Ensete ventricosum]
MPRRGAGAFIVSVVDHSYLVTLLLLWPTMSSYSSTTLVVLARQRQPRPREMSAVESRAGGGKLISVRLVDLLMRPY